MTFDQTQTDFRNAKVTGSESEQLSYSLAQRADSLARDERLQLEMEFVRNNPKSIVSANILNIYKTTWGKEKTKALFSEFPERNKQNEYGKKIAEYLELNREPLIGDKFVDFEMANQRGMLQKLSDVRGKVILLEFWASWCAPCRQENPNLVKTYNRYKPLGFEIFAVSLDTSKESWVNAIKSDGLTWQQVSDLKGSENNAGLIYGIKGIPDKYLIDNNGIIISRNIRGEELNEQLAMLLE